MYNQNISSFSKSRHAVLCNSLGFDESLVFRLSDLGDTKTCVQVHLTDCAIMAPKRFLASNKHQKLREQPLCNMTVITGDCYHEAEEHAALIKKEAR